MDIFKKIKKNTGKGFTLIELLVVVLIIGILAAIAVPQYTKAVEVSRIKGTFPLLKNLSDAQQRYFLQHGSYTNRLEDLDIDVAYTKNEKGPTHEAMYLSGKQGVAVIFNSGVVQNQTSRGITLQFEPDNKTKCLAYTSDRLSKPQSFYDGLCKSLGFSTKGGTYSSEDINSGQWWE